MLRVTAAIPAFNAARFLSQAIESVMVQTHSPFEVLVIDDGSTDDSLSIARSFKGVRCISQSNRGDAGARNRALTEAKGDLIAFLDADDVWLPDKLESQLEIFGMRPELGMVYTGVTVVDEDLRTLEELRSAPAAVALRNTLVVEKPYMTGVGSSGLVRLEVARAIGFDERLRASADWAFAVSVAMRHPVDRIDRPLVLYRQHALTQVHRNLAAVENDMRLVWSEVFADGRLDPHLRSLRRRALANLCLSLAASYLKRGDRMRFVRYLGSALVLRPDRVVAAIWRRYMVPPS
jgi:glycosyltransferase involved in cell wall biosynthesis